MLTIRPRTLWRDALVGFGFGLVLALGMGLVSYLNNPSAEVTQVR